MRAVDFFVADFFAATFGVDAFLAAAVVAGAFAVVFLAAVDFVVLVVAGVALVVVAFVVDALVVPRLEAFLAVVVLLGVVFADADLVADFLAGAAAVLAATSFGNFFSPATTALSSAPGRNFATEVFFARLRSPVRGLRTIRAGRSIRSNAPKPVMPTFSPDATCRVMVSSTDSSACAAARLLFSKRFANSSVN